jgi:hypothetical protein
MDIARMPRKWPGSLSELIESRSCPNSFRIATPPPRPFYQQRAQKSMFETWGGAIFQDYFFRLTAQNVHFAEGQNSEYSYRAPVLHQIYQSPVVDPRRDRLLWAQKSFKGGSRLPRNDPSIFKRQDDASFYQNHMQNTQHSF